MPTFNSTAFFIIAGYYLVINLIMYISMSADKYFATKNKRRIPEKNLFLLAVLGGGLAGLFAMIIKRHKSKHISFILVYSIMAILHILAIYALFKLFVII